MSSGEQNSIIYKINDHFKLPVYYNSDKVELNKNIIDDLELIRTDDQSNNTIYSFCFNNDNDVSKIITNQVCRYYTTDTNFLKDTQTLIKEYISPAKKYTHISPNYKNIADTWNEIKIESGFKEKYHYIDWDIIEFLNTSESFLQLISIYNLLSPLISFIVPIIILIIPFFILKIKGLPLNISDYIEVLKTVAQTNAIGKLFTVNFGEITAQEKIYILLSAAFYIFSIYQNVMVCSRFHANMKDIHAKFGEINSYLTCTLDGMTNYLNHSSSLSSHTTFNDNLKTKMTALENISTKINSITQYNLYNVKKIGEIGKILKYFYELHSNDEFTDAILYSIGFNGYLDCLEGIQTNVVEKKINFATFIPKNKKAVFKNSYYACLKDETPVKNTIKFNKNLIITGPNASGKTTILKSTLINIILTQQFGCGFYESAKFAPFRHIHCYLNIPDTSGRDSLFQAEARRCKEIIDVVKNNENDSHFCMFDELYSGTNPEEAETSAVAFMNYLQKFKKVNTMLTTHFVNVCKKLDDVKGIQNAKMDVVEKNKRICYTYKLEKGISIVKGGIYILSEMNYPKEIVDNEPFH